MEEAFNTRARVAEIACLTGIAPWKRGRTRAMFRNLHGPILRNRAEAAVRVAKRHGGAVACWASRIPRGLEIVATREGVALWWIEDGFIRSAGLGASMIQPASLTLDSRCPHYDSRQPSDLEQMLETANFSDLMLTRADRLIARLRETAVTKYNLAGSPITLPEGKRIVLVPGQVPGDRSVLLGGDGLDMAELLARVRHEEPDALIVYKPHPDVVSGLRRGDAGDTEARRIANLVFPHADLIALIDRADVVHTLTSLTGFEALIRGRAVVVHGQPFYAGWGLTRDLAPIARRTRHRSLAELVAAALIAYPLYADPRTGEPCTPEHLVEQFAAMRRREPGDTSILRAFAARFAAWHAARRERGKAGQGNS